MLVEPAMVAERPQTQTKRRGETSPLLSVSDLSVTVTTLAGLRTAVHSVSFDIAAGETLCLVGESASGKSLTALSILGLHAPNVLAKGEISLNGTRLTDLPDGEMARIRGRDISMIFQETVPALNPVKRIGDQLCEALCVHTGLSKQAAQARAVDLLHQVGINRPKDRMRAFPFELSGGMAQRVMIAMALAAGPNLLIADEPTTALDVTIQAQILDLLADLRTRHQLAMLLISHDMGVVAELADRVAVMYAGRIVEVAPVLDLFDTPAHPYTHALLATRRSLDAVTRLEPIAGEPPNLNTVSTGCAFAPRCPRASSICTAHVPQPTDISGHLVACHHPLGAGA